MALFEKPIALTPRKGGGSCINQGALQSADLIVSTTMSATSAAIRVGTKSQVSHAMLYIGNGEIVEAIGEKGVVRRSLISAIADAALAVAYRSPDVREQSAGRITQYALSQVGASYSVAGAIMSTRMILCRLSGPLKSGFFCSQLVFEAYRQGGVPLSDAPSQCIAPNDAVSIAERRLTYVGHLKGTPAWFPVLSP